MSELVPIQEGVVIDEGCNHIIVPVELRPEYRADEKGRMFIYRMYVSKYACAGKCGRLLPIDLKHLVIRETT